MKTTSKQFWPKLFALITVLMLSACGGSTSNDSGAASSAVLTGSGPWAPVGSHATPPGSPVIVGYDDGSVYQFSGDTNGSNFLTNGPGFNSPVNFMASYISNNVHYLVVEEANDSLIRWDGNNWQALPFTGAASVTQMISYKNSVVVGLADGEMWQLVNDAWVAMHDNGFQSAVSHMAVQDDSLVISLADGAIFKWNGDTDGHCDKGQTDCWSDLNSPAHTSRVAQLIAYQDNHGATLLAAGLTNGANFIYDGSTWTGIGDGDGGSAQITQMVAFANQNSVGQNSFLVAYSDGSVFQWVAEHKIWYPALSIANSGPVTELITYKDTFIAAFQNNLMQVAYQPGNVITRQSISGSSWGSNVTQMEVVNNELIARLANGEIKKWDGNTNGIWNDLGISQFTSQQPTLMSTYNDQLVLGFVNGSVLQWDDFGTFVYTKLHDNGWGSAVEYLVSWNNSPVVGLANGAVEVFQNNGSWKEYEDGSPKVTCDGEYNRDMQQYQLVVLPNEDGLVVGLSRGQDAMTAPFSGSIMKDLSLGQLVVPGSEICVHDYDDSENTYKDEITQMIVYHNGVYAGYDDGGIVRAWDGNTAHSLAQLHDAGWTRPVRAMGIVNDHLIVGLENGAIEQWDGDGTNLNITSWTELHDSGYGVSVSQIMANNGKVTVRYANGNITQLSDNGTWITLEAGSQSPVTQMTNYQGDIVYGTANGMIWRIAGSGTTDPTLQALPDIGLNSAVNQIVDNGNLIVGFANGAVMQWDGSQWTVISTANGHAVRQLMVQ